MKKKTKKKKKKIPVNNLYRAKEFAAREFLLLIYANVVLTFPPGRKGVIRIKNDKGFEAFFFFF